ncbi:MAG: hypothetical protein EAZ08_10990 [Cytophagales bacterium]|nr:MAG: hypothetical protein EAZ08_10990 [Cytophagales bacterium]
MAVCFISVRTAFKTNLEENKKIMVGNLKQLLLEIATKPMEEQKKQIETTFEQWKGNQKQTEDVIVLGIRV